MVSPLIWIGGAAVGTYLLLKPSQKEAVKEAAVERIQHYARELSGMTKKEKQTAAKAFAADIIQKESPAMLADPKYREKVIAARIATDVARG